MDIKELIAQLLDKQKGQSAEMRVLLGSAAGTIENLLGQVDAMKAELRDERHRHDRYVDFELAEAEELRKLKEQLRWISVKDGLPFAEYGESDDVLAMTELGVMRTLYFDGGNWCFQNGECCAYKVTHWMPLPNPPEGE